jgi:hypothetical protein
MACAATTLLVTLPADAAAAADLRARIEALCGKVPGASVVCQAPEAAALANVGHRGANEQVEAMLCEGLYENAAEARTLGLPCATQPYSESITTSDLGTCASLDTLLARPLRNTVHGNLGADIVVLTRDADDSVCLHLMQLKRGTTRIGYPKSTCGPTNKGRSAYYIREGLVKIGRELEALLKARPAGDVARVTCRYYLLTTADVRKNAKALFDRDHVTVIAGAAPLAALLPKRIQDAARVLF